MRRLKTTEITKTLDDARKKKAEESRIKPHSPFSPCRRKFIGDFGGITAATIVTGAIGLPAVSLEARTVPKDESLIAASGSARAERAYDLRVQAALFQKLLPLPEHPDNGDEERYQNKIGNYPKGLLHHQLGEVDLIAYHRLLQTLKTGNPDEFLQISMGGEMLLKNPQAGLAFALEGADPAHLYQPHATARDLSKFSDFRGSRLRPRVTRAQRDGRVESGAALGAHRCAIPGVLKCHSYFTGDGSATRFEYPVSRVS